MRQLLIACVLLLVGLVVAGVRAEELQRSVTVSAQSEIVVKPDEVLIDFVVSSQHKELLAARSTNDQVTESVFQITHRLDLTPENVKVTDLEVSPVHDRFDGSLVGYSVKRSITVRIHRFSIIEDFIAGLLDAGVTDIERLNFQVRDQRPHQREARRLAFEYAREKATHLAELSGLVLGDVITVDEDVQYNEDAGGGGMGGFGGFGGVSSVSPRPSDGGVVATSGSDAARRAEQLVFRTVAFQEQTPKTSEAGANDTKLLAPGVARLNATVTVKFELRKPRAETGPPSRRP